MLFHCRVGQIQGIAGTRDCIRGRLPYRSIVFKNIGQTRQVHINGRRARREDLYKYQKLVYIHRACEQMSIPKREQE